MTLTAAKRLFLLLIAAALFLLYLATLHTIPNGSDHYYMLDVGETQVVLNVWGTLHATGYPLYVMSGSLLVAALKGFGVSAAAAPALVSLLWGLLALIVLYALAAHLTRRSILPAAVIALLGLTRTVWIHSAIAEIYSFGLLILALLLALALWRDAIRGRIYWLALLGGSGVAHHRALIMAAPALLFAVWPLLNAPVQRSRLPRVVLISLVLGLLGLLQYLYLPLRASVGAAWVYGAPGTLVGLWDQFIGAEASRFIGAPRSLAENFAMVNQVLVTDLTLPGLLLGLSGLIVALRSAHHRRASIALGLSGGIAYLFHVFVYSDVLSALILPVTLSIAFGWLFLGDWLLSRAVRGRKMQLTAIFLALISAVLAFVLIGQNLGFIRDLTQNRAGLETIEQVRRVTPGSTLMIPWGMRHHAVGFARDVLGELPGIELVDHKADFRAILNRGQLVTLASTFYQHPLIWWEERLGQRVFLRADAPALVQIDVQPKMVDEGTPLPDAVNVVSETLNCEPTALLLDLVWAAPQTPERDLSVFVHLLDGEGTIISQADQFAPVSGWRPLTTWAAGEMILDGYLLPRPENAAVIRYGLYRQLENGEFRNEYEFELAVQCDSVS